MQQPSSFEIARCIVGALVASGVRDVVYSPGSRCAPLAYALEEAQKSGDVRIYIRIDERSAGFVAVGLSRAGIIADPRGEPRPVALVATSGSAIAQYHPAIAEASHSGLPLIVISADRPFEMRGVGATQTTTQPGIFAAHTRKVWDIPADQSPDQRTASLVGRAVCCARGLLNSSPGPVQINVGLRDPLIPTSWPTSERPHWSVPVIERRHITPTLWEEVVDIDMRTVLIAGDGCPTDAAQWAEAAQIPVLAEPTSGMQRCSTWIPNQQALLQSDSLLLPNIEQVIVAGRPTLSRPVSALLARSDLRIIVVGDSPEWVDVAGQATVVVPHLSTATNPHSDTQWLSQWRQASERTQDQLASLRDTDELTMISAMNAIWNTTSACLVLGASNTIRSADLIAHVAPLGCIVSNRGLAGIDGTISTALGLSWGLGQPVRAVMGDLTFFHDASALALTLGSAIPDVQLIIFDDNGGGIFDTLEYSQPHVKSSFEQWFGTPQNVSIEDLAQAYHTTYSAVETLDDLRKYLNQPFSGLSILHLRIPRPTQQLNQAKNAFIEASRNYSDFSQ